MKQYLAWLLISAVVLSGCVAAPQPPTEKHSFIASDKSLQSNYAVIDAAYLNKPGYVVIQKDDNGKPGKVLGYSELIAGARNDIKLELSEGAGARAFAKIYYDNGDSKFDKADPAAEESKNATITLYKIGKGTSEPGGLQSTANFESADVVATMLEIYPGGENAGKELGEIRVQRILWQSIGGDLKEADVVNIFFPAGTKEKNETFCPSGGNPGPPCYELRAINVRENDTVLGHLESNLADTTYHRTTFSPAKVLSQNPTCEELGGKALPARLNTGEEYNKCADPTFNASDSDRCCRRLCSGDSCHYG